PDELQRLWRDLFPGEPEPQACLVNFYTDDAKMGLHQDRDETNRTAPVLSVSLGNACLFRIGGTERRDPTQSFRLESGDVMALTGAARDAFHGVDRIYPDTSDLLKDGGRVNVTLRRVT
ncbi:MAG: alpha-ketoglutarate-dependent dioxygenase AlkB, partial [Pseudomonadota bacterium]